MDYEVLKNELTSDPLGRLYDADPQIAANTLNTADRQVPRTTMSPSEVFNAIDSAEYDALTPADQQKIWDILHMGGNLNPFGREAAIFTQIFTGGSNTITTLAALRQNTVSRAQELGLGTVRPGDVEFARTL